MKPSSRDDGGTVLHIQSIEGGPITRSLLAGIPNLIEQAFSTTMLTMMKRVLS